MYARSVSMSGCVRAREPLPGREAPFLYRLRPMRPLVSPQVSGWWAEPGATVGGTGRNAVTCGGATWAQLGATLGATTESER